MAPPGDSDRPDGPGNHEVDEFLKDLAAAPSRTLPSASPHVDADPDALAHFEVLERIGEGGMGIVYRARDRNLGRVVALKVLPPGFAADETRRRRFIREARLAAAVQHRNLVTVFELGEAQTRIYIAMEWVEGQTLRASMHAGPLPWTVAVPLFVQIADGVAQAHAAGIVHRDLKPENVIVGGNGDVKVLDFGLAKLPQGETMRVTSTGEQPILGTPPYMSPEQLRGNAVSAASDVFALGVMLHEALTGERPFRGKNLPQLIRSLERDVPAAPSERHGDIPRAVDMVVARCIARDACERYPDAGELLADLRCIAVP